MGICTRESPIAIALIGSTPSRPSPVKALRPPKAALCRAFRHFYAQVQIELFINRISWALASKNPTTG
jgi:hypothetical protein